MKLHNPRLAILGAIVFGGIFWSCVGYGATVAVRAMDVW
jgi:hypothetical protein